MLLARVVRSAVQRTLPTRSMAGAASSFAVPKHPVETETDVDGQTVFFRKVNSQKVYTNKDGIPLAEAYSSLEWVLPSPPPFHCFEEPPQIVTCNNLAAKGVAH